MSWADCVLQDWSDCEWADWADCEWDKFETQDRRAGTRAGRQLPPEGLGNFKSPYLHCDVGYVQDSQQYPDAAIAEALSRTRDEAYPHMKFKQPYRYDDFIKMKYQDKPAFPHHETLSAQNMLDSPQDIIDQEAIDPTIEYEWRWVRYFDFSRWTATTGEWFDNRWLEASGTGWAAYFDNTRWTPWAGAWSWDGSKWVADPTDWFPELGAIGGWNTGFRPTHARVTFTGSPDFMSIEDQAAFDHYNSGSYSSGTSVALDWTDQNGHEMTDIYSLTVGFYPGARSITNIEFYPATVSGINLSVLGDWYKDLRPKKFRMSFDEATADVSLKDTNATEIYANATYASGDEVAVDFAGADIDNLVVSSSGDITDIEFLVQVEKGTYLASDQRRPRQSVSLVSERAPLFPSVKVRSSVRLPRHTNLRPMRGT